MFADSKSDTFKTGNSDSHTIWYLGLDIGTSSVGWTVTNEQYHIPRLRGQRAWGVRLFEQAETSANRRMHRIARRRCYRRAERLKYLRQIFSPYIEPIDPGFFGRMKDSFLWSEDKREQQANSLFNDPDYTDKDFYHDFPTIFHLRDFLMDPASASFTPKKLDARHYYLAIHHIIKYRGHFLFEGDIEINTDNTRVKFAELYQRLQLELRDFLHFTFGTIYESKSDEVTREVDFEEVLLEILSQRGNLNGKKARLKGLNIETDLDEEEGENVEHAKGELLKYLIGAKADLAKITKCEDKFEIQLGQASTEDKIAEASGSIGEQWQPILEIGKDLYNLGIVR
ncbi:MAG: hypothetical protein LBU07_02470, partial [Coriobacteriales bacterium]|nr:hypothetical protein [Coriobacteriales bacterium]